MTRWAVIFDDTPAMLAHRKANAEAHVEYIKQNKAKVLIGGGLKPTPDAPFVGGLWIVDTDTYDEVVDLVTADPYYFPDARRFNIFHWGGVLPDLVTL